MKSKPQGVKREKVYQSVQEELDDLEFKRLNRERAAERYHQAPVDEAPPEDGDQTRSDPYLN